jgi:hypothetical protein
MPLTHQFFCETVPLSIYVWSYGLLHIVPGPELQPSAVSEDGRLQEPAQAALTTPRP